MLNRLLNAAAISNRSKAALAACLVIGFSVLNLRLLPDFHGLEMNPFGGFLLAGLPYSGITVNMPLFETVVSLAFNLGVSPAVFFVLLHSGIYTLVFCAACLLRGYRAGILSLGGAGLLEAAGIFQYNAEQSFYSFLLLLVLSLLLLRRGENSLKYGLLAGLAVGASLLVRTPLFLFPPLAVICDRIYNGKRPGFVPRSLVFLAASYVLLVPWGALNYSLSGKFSLFDDHRAACNIITAAKGSIYTMNGDPQRAAGIGNEVGAFEYFLREVKKKPLFYALTTLRRLWHIFLFYPLLFGLFIAAMAASREKEKLIVFGLPVYFILVHSLLSVEIRYFYPMLYLLPPLIAGGLLPGSSDRSAPGCDFARKAAVSAFWLSFCAVLAVEALIIAYPYRAARNVPGSGSFYAALDRFPNDRVFRSMKCGELWEKGEDAAFYKCLGAYSEKFGDEVKAYFLSALASASPAKLALPAGGEMNHSITVECLIIRMLREFELGDRAAAMTSFGQAYAAHDRWHNKLQGDQAQGAPYKSDKELTVLLKQDYNRFWDRYVYGILLLWPPESIGKILSGLRKNVAVSPELRLLEYSVKNIQAAGGAGRRLLAGDAFRGCAGDILASRPGSFSLLKERAGFRDPAARAYLGVLLSAVKKDIERSRKLSDSAVGKMRSGDLKAAEGFLLEALNADPRNPEALISLCAIRFREGKKEQALKACQEAAGSIYASEDNRRPGLEILAGEAEFESYKILGALGRDAEAKEALRRAVKNTPVSWPRLGEAKAALEKTAR